MEKRFKNSVDRSPVGRYIVTLPFKHNLSLLGDNQKLAFSRLMGLLKHLKVQPELLRAVDQEIRRYCELGYAERAKPRQPGERAHYLPLLAVAKKSLGSQSELKVRVVKMALLKPGMLHPSVTAWSPDRRCFRILSPCSCTSGKVRLRSLRISVERSINF